ncbi:MAG: OstA-like protein [Bacteroidota bacterium]
MIYKRCFLFIFLFILILNGWAQEQAPTHIILEKADSWTYNKEIRHDVQRLLGNVIFSHDSAYLYCDSAYLHETENVLTAYGNVRIKLSDTLNLYSDSLRYDGNTKVAYANSNVRLIDNQTILTTDTLIYDRKTRIARYDYWGKIVNDKNILISLHGNYFTDIKEFFFKDKVLLIHPDYTMHSDTLMYNTVSEVAFFFGPSNITSNDKKDSIYCENGWYNTRQDNARFRERARIYHEVSMLTGDSLYYERKNGFGQVFKNALLIDTVQNILLMGNYGELQRARGFAFMTDSAISVMVDKKDSLFMHGDTVRALFDSAQNIKEVCFFYKVKFFRSDLQGMCDSLVYHSKDSCMTMYNGPAIWSGINQLTADSISLTVRNGLADSLKMYGSAFIISKDDSVRFNQIKGRTLLARFRDNELYKVRVLGNAETLYYAREEDRTLIGINKARSSEMLIFLEKNQLSTITYIGKPEAHLYPEKLVPQQELKLRNFKWLQERRPLRKEDIFKWE